MQNQIKSESSRSHTSDNKSQVTIHLPSHSEELFYDDKKDTKIANRVSVQEESILDPTPRPQTPNKTFETFYNFITHFDSERSESLIRSLGFSAAPKEIQELQIKDDQIMKEKK